jgi:hypothetical protein
VRAQFVFLLASSLAACSSSSSSAGGADADLTEDAGGDAAIAADGGDAAPPPPPVPPPPPLPACLGDSRAITVLGGTPSTEVRIGAAPSPYAAQMLVDFATTRSTIEMSVFAPPGPPATGCDSSQLGQSCTFADYDFFGPWGQVTLVTSTIGLLGTDFLAVHVFTLDLRGKRIFKATKATKCDDASLSAFAPLSTAGFYANDTSTLRPITDVDSSASPGSHVPNVPTVPITLAGTQAIAQLDTGFLDNLVPHSVNVNVALFDAVNAAHPGALVRDAALDAQLTTCVGIAEAVEAYRLAPGSSFELATHAWPDAVVFVKRTPAAAKSCGGIGTWTTAAAQIGGSFFADVGVIVFDPFASSVWIAR